MTARISIHAPREGSDFEKCCPCPHKVDFYPRSPRGERHRHLVGGRLFGQISIHAPREGSDGSRRRPLAHPAYFYPRSPRGERLITYHVYSKEGPFLSTLPARGATLHPCFFVLPDVISIHAPREGSDHNLGGRPDSRSISIHAPREGSDGLGRQDGDPHPHFYPRSPRGERPASRTERAGIPSFLSTLPARGAT